MKGPSVEIDMLRWMNRTALELVGQGGFGHSFDPLTEDGRHPLGEAIKELVSVSSSHVVADNTDFYCTY